MPSLPLPLFLFRVFFGPLPLWLLLLPRVGFLLPCIRLLLRIGLLLRIRFLLGLHLFDRSVDEADGSGCCRSIVFSAATAAVSVHDSILKRLPYRLLKQLPPRERRQYRSHPIGRLRRHGHHDVIGTFVQGQQRFVERHLILRRRHRSSPVAVCLVVIANLPPGRHPLPPLTRAFRLLPHLGVVVPAQEVLEHGLYPRGFVRGGIIVAAQS
mmetsp:Transcript_35911/g.86674  ORF Transcript_35911/g.86674 Transcript_35911/m.86674 type:complete len:211 (-) Transcript_35911:1272-1904(-)